MRDEPNLAELLAVPREKTTPARRDELLRRRGKAQGMARLALGRLHRDEYQALYRQAAAKVNLEAGPLPGDEA